MAEMRERILDAASRLVHEFQSWDWRPLTFRAVADRAASREGTTITVSNEVGSGIVPDNPLSRRYRDVLGRVNIAFSGYAADAFLVVAGRALPLPAVPSARLGPRP